MARKHIIVLLVIASCFIFPSTTDAIFDTTDWQFYRQILNPGQLKSGYAFFQVDADIYDGSHNGLSSLRIVDHDSNEVPYEIVTREGSEQREEFHAQILNNSYGLGKYNLLLLDTGKETAEINEAVIQTTQKNFMRRVSVEGSNDQRTWATLAPDSYIFDFSHNVQAQDMRIEIPPSHFRYLRFKVFDDGSGELKISGIRLFSVEEERAVTEPWTLTIIGKFDSDDNATTDFIIDTIYRGLPLQQIKVDISDKNYQRLVDIQSSEDKKTWVDLGTGVIYSYDLPQFKKTDNLLSFDQNVKGRFFKLTMYNYDKYRLAMTGATGYGLIRRVVFPLTAKGPYTLYYGNPSAQEPQHKSAPQISYMQTEQLPRLELGPRQATAGQDDTGAADDNTDNYFFWFIVAVLIFFFIVFIFSVTSPTQHPGKHDDPPDDF